MSKATTKPNSRTSKLSPEVTWYLKSRGVPKPDRPPTGPRAEAARLAATRGRAEARFDPERVDRVLHALNFLGLRPEPSLIGYVIAPLVGWVRPDGKGGWIGFPSL